MESQKGGFAARLTEIAGAHPEAERFEIWSQDEARVGQKGRTGHVWWQRGQTPRDVGFQSAWIIGAVCPAPWSNEVDQDSIGETQQTGSEFSRVDRFPLILSIAEYFAGHFHAL